MTTHDEAPAAGRRRRLSSQERRRQLLDLGLALGRELPPEEVTMDLVAEKAGVSRGLVFHYFESTQDFHLAVLREQAAELLIRTEPPEGVESPEEAAQAALSSYIEYIESNPVAYTSLLRGALSADPAMRAVTEETRNEVARRILTFAPAMGIVVTPTVQAAVQGWIALVEDVITRWIAQPTMGRDQVLALITGALMAVTGAAAAVDG